MNVRERELAAIARLRNRARAGESLAIYNIAAGYRLLGRSRLAFAWWLRGAVAGDGSAMLDVGYCYQHRYGVRADLTQAAHWYEAAIHSVFISQAEREEAMYFLATVLLLQDSRGAARARVLRLLKRANADGDYPVAAELQRRVESCQAIAFCTCRRRLRPKLARAKCSQHARRAA